MTNLQSHLVMKSKFLVVIAGLFISTHVVAQLPKFEYSRQISGVNEPWHSLRIPDDMYAHINRNFSDIRIAGLMANGDTVEVPYLVKERLDRQSKKELDVEITNRYKKPNFYYYEFRAKSNEPVNQVVLDVVSTNFNWLITLEGSSDKKRWHTIIKEHRIIGIEEHGFSYKYAKLSFDTVRYTYFRVKIPAFITPRLNGIKLYHMVKEKGKRNHPVIDSLHIENRKEKQETIIDVRLKEAVPLAYLRVQVLDSIDFYRPIEIRYALDSFRRDSVWHYKYRSLYTGTLSSLDTTGFRFPNRVVKYLHLNIRHYDNAPLSIKGIALHGFHYDLVARFDKPANYYLYYGNPKARMPSYDIGRFTASIPKSPPLVKLAPPVKITSQETDTETLRIANYWLWAIMLVAIGVLGWFSFNMLKNE